ncbi:MAG: SAM-dependent DNA methyltransferase [Tissierellia bacterium]|nr:SAM-dependent DNA methyltransferase [Tissierellia bacterium]
MITSEEIKRTLWAAANQLRGSMDASRYKDYMLGLMFYKFLSDKTLDTYRKLGKYFDLTEQELIDQYKEQTDQQSLRLYGLIEKTQGYYVEAKYLYQMWLRDIDAGEFELEKVIESLNNFERTISKDSDDFKGLFSSSTMDLSNTALGSSLKDRSNSIKSLIELFADKNMVELQEGDVLGDAYEYLIGMFAMESGKKAGEFYTPRQVSEVMAQIVAESGKIRDIYDPTVGFRVIIVIEANSYVNIRSSRLLPKFKTQKINSWCAA